MNFTKFALKVLYSNEFIYNLYKRDKYKYHVDLFKKKKYKFLLTDDNFNYDGGIFYYFINNKYKINYSDKLVDNISINYSMIINNSLFDLLNVIDDKVYFSFMEKYYNSIKLEVEKNNSENKNRIIDSIDNMFKGKCVNLFDALQRILLINQLMWQTGHRLNVLGRLDYILDDLYKNTNISQEEAKKIILEFLKVLHRDYYYKSNALKGDTGQVIIIGGLNLDNTYFYNDLTYIFIECIKELNLPDPKILLRVSKNMKEDILKEAIDCIETGCGSPLLSNDDIVIKGLLDIGYSPEDAYNYATSACWEPLCDGAALEQNNIDDLNFVNVLNNTIYNRIFNSFDELFNEYKSNIVQEINRIVNKLNKLKFAYDPLLSTFLEGPSKNKLDVSNGGAKYNNFGILTTGLGNSIDALFNIKKLVFEDKKYDIEFLKNELKNNFNNDNIRNELESNDMKYGMDNDQVISMTNELIDLCNIEFKKHKNQFNGVYRFGLSSPNYISNSITTMASLDGRKDFDPFIVHISSNAEVPYTELVNFASSLHYGDRNVNGNVIDLILSPSFISNNKDKMFTFLKVAIEKRFFQMQFNVIDSKTLIEAKNNPQQYKNLIVRVWGFSAYFTELPENYQELLIRRAIQSERSC